jgi:hypothetical protein
VHMHPHQATAGYIHTYRAPGFDLGPSLSFFRDL